ncbi:hypothetical protein [Actinoplanes teichomyceticus]|uniref:Uncharacterized protein n=1 Tax=Actinoplanes teichomyceticus TaxID=1867 RepID=A0A561VFY9_ACTTI|nr:hypothetical protein [Actinoplanes teichomyceticus]TWG10533.1 hypothetical protein FHX34_10723 [Actinoplanes teichomyceticus]GIF15305.1 hypothetical protein Ate01nite_53370 [Actinoplanes teichomyceticus]
MAEPERRRRRVRPPSAATPAAEPAAPAPAAPVPVPVPAPPPAAPGPPPAAPGPPPAAPGPPRPAKRPAPSGGAGEEREAERGLRGLVGSGSSQVSVGAALRARDASRPTDEQLAEAERDLVIVRRNWLPREDLPRR